MGIKSTLATLVTILTLSSVAINSQAQITEHPNQTEITHNQTSHNSLKTPITFDQTGLAEFLELNYGHNKEYEEKTKYLQQLVNEAKETIIPKKNYDSIEAVNLFQKIHSLFDKYEIKKDKKGTSGKEAFAERKFDCWEYSLTIKAISDVIGIDIGLTKTELHIFPQITLKNEKTLYWEILDQKVKTREEYIKDYNVYPAEIANKIYLSEITDKQLESIMYYEKGVYVEFEENREAANKYYLIAEKLDPTNLEVYLNGAYSKEISLQEQLTDIKKSLVLCPESKILAKKERKVQRKINSYKPNKESEL